VRVHWVVRARTGHARIRIMAASSIALQLEVKASYAFSHICPNNAQAHAEDGARGLPACSSRDTRVVQGEHGLLSSRALYTYTELTPHACWFVFQ